MRADAENTQTTPECNPQELRAEEPLSIILRPDLLLSKSQ